MDQAEDVGNDEVSLGAIARTVRRYSRRIILAALAGAVVAVLPALVKRRTYTASALVISATSAKGADPRLRGLASQFGLGTLAEGNGPAPTAIPAFLVRLAVSPVILTPILNDSVLLNHDGRQEKRAIIDLLVKKKDRLTPRAAAQRQVEAVRELQTWIRRSQHRETNAVQLAVTSPWAPVSLRVARRILEELDRFNVAITQAQASEERRFVGQRVSEQRAKLRQAEDRLASFLERNRQFRNSAQLSFEYERLQREVMMAQEVLVALIQSNEDARIQEIRDTPVLTVIEPPVYPVEADSRGLAKRALIGALLFGFVAILAAVMLFENPRAGTSYPVAGSSI